jgi:hypothetical protein
MTACVFYDRVRHILDGPVHWSITDGQLTITKGELGSLVYRSS